MFIYLDVYDIDGLSIHYLKVLNDFNDERFNDVRVTYDCAFVTILDVLVCCLDQSDLLICTINILV